MRKHFFVVGALSTFLLIASPALALITAVLENPEAGPTSGFAIVSGWAFAFNDIDGIPTPVDVTVKVRIDGITQNDIPCCSPRADVQGAPGNEGAPLETGFAGQILYSLLSAGPHTIGIEVTAEGCDPSIIDRSVVVVKPGGAAFVSELDVSGATASTDAEGILVNGATVSPGETTTDLDIEYQTASQSFAIRGPTPTTPKLFIANLNGEQEVDLAAAETSQPVVETKASGSGTFVLNVNGSNTLDYRIEVDNIEGLLSLPADTQPTSSAHIHRAGAGANGEIEIFLSPAVPTGPPFVWEGTAFLSDELLDALLAGELYVNVHTAENAAGEVRGQIVADARNCQDPTRTAFVGSPEKPEIGGTNTEGCPSFLDPQSCATGWQISPNSGQSVQCVWRAQSLRCGACGPTLENSGQCSNSCR